MEGFYAGSEAGQAKRPGMESNSPHSHEYEKRLLIFHSPGLSLVS
ncbi:hypothetical protein SD78_1363 [Bacillus badius]|nr:hypothetical protein SD78_1363 [Bacillus badius]